MHPLTRAIALAWIGLLFSSAASGLAITTGDGSGNTTPPPDDPGFANVGPTTGTLTGVYLGDRWVLTAHHVGEQNMVFGGVTYPIIPGSRVQLMTGAVGADLAMLRLQTAPPLPTPVIASVPLVGGEDAILIGNGDQRLPDLYCWNNAFTEISCPPPGPAAAFSGYKRSAALRLVRWGVNEIVEVDQEALISGRTTHFFTTAFDASGPLHESQALNGDSGGAVFVKRGNQWELVGTLFAILVWQGQPADTAVFGDLTLAADLYFYRQQILDIMNPTPVVPMLPFAAWTTTAVLLAGTAVGALRRRNRVR